MNLLYRRFNPVSDIRAYFDCGDSDLNEFLLETDTAIPNASFHGNEMLAVTYVIEEADTHCIVAYFSLLHDKIDREFSDATMWNRLSRAIPNAKRRTSYPALKIGRLAINKQYQGQGIGGKILHFIELYYLRKQMAGCRFITVDALRSASSFYKKHRFHELASSEHDETVLMYFDLKSMI